jgi:hypothetical protein
LPSRVLPDPLMPTAVKVARFALDKPVNTRGPHQPFHLSPWTKFCHVSTFCMPACAPSFLQCKALVNEGAVMGSTPAEVVQKCDITFAMLSDPEAALQASTVHTCRFCACGEGIL